MTWWLCARRTSQRHVDVADDHHALHSLDELWLRADGGQIVVALGVIRLSEPEPECTAPKTVTVSTRTQA